MRRCERRSARVTVKKNVPPGRKLRRYSTIPKGYPGFRYASSGLRLLRLLAEASGLHRTYIGEIERAACNVGLDNLEKLVVGLEVELGDLFSDGEPAGLWRKGG